MLWKLLFSLLLVSWWRPLCQLCCAETAMAAQCCTQHGGGVHLWWFSQGLLHSACCGAVLSCPLPAGQFRWMFTSQQHYAFFSATFNHPHTRGGRIVSSVPYFVAVQLGFAPSSFFCDPLTGCPNSAICLTTTSAWFLTISTVSSPSNTCLPAMVSAGRLLGPAWLTPRCAQRVLRILRKIIWE